MLYKADNIYILHDQTLSCSYRSLACIIALLEGKGLTTDNVSASFNSPTVNSIRDLSALS